MKSVDKNKEVLKWIAKNLFAISATVVALANLWLFSKLSPISQDIAIIKNKVLANEEKIEIVSDDCDDTRTELWEEMRYIRNRVDTIYNLIK